MSVSLTGRHDCKHRDFSWWCQGSNLLISVLLRPLSKGTSNLVDQISSSQSISIFNHLVWPDLRMPPQILQKCYLSFKISLCFNWEIKAEFYLWNLFWLLTGLNVFLVVFTGTVLGGMMTNMLSASLFYVGC